MKLRPLAYLAISCVLTFSLSSCKDGADESTKEAAKPIEAGLALTGADKRDVEPEAIVANPDLPPLPIETLGRVATLPESYPETWVLVNELSFTSMYGGKVIILDAAEQKPERRIKGIMDKFLMGNFTQSVDRGEYYILETFHERGSRGARTDVLAIYDKSTLKIEKEIVWPKPGRLQALPERYAMSVTPDEKYLFASNFNPAASITVIDLDKREIVEQIGTPGCVLSYPVGKRGVASICSNGAILNSEINDAGELVKQAMTEPFFDTMATPVFEHPVFYKNKMYFPSFTGDLHVFDIKSNALSYSGKWDLLNEEDKKGHWRPSGMVLNDVDDQGMMYTIFHPDGHEGSQTHGGPEVWVFDLNKRERVRRIEIPNWAISISVTRGESPLLIVASGELNLDVFDANTGNFVHTISDFGNVTPLSIDKSF